MAIGDFTRIAQQPLQNAVVGQNERGRIELQEPLKAPSKWTRFKAALSNVPLLGQIGTLQKARASVADYPVKLENYRATNRQILEGFVTDLQSRFGTNVADMALREARPQDGAPLSQRTVATIIGQAEKSENHHKAMTNTDLYRFIYNPLSGGARLPGETDMTDVFLDMGREIPEHCNSWQQAIGPDRAKIVEGLIRQAIHDHPDYGKGAMPNRTIEAAARDALNVLADLEADLSSAPGMTEDRLEEILAAVSQRDTPAKVAIHAREMVIVPRLEQHLDRTNPDSMLRRTVSGLVEERGLPAPADAVLKSIRNSIVEKLSSLIEAMPDEFDCDPQLNALCEALDTRLEGAVRTAIDAHMTALAQLDRPSETREPAQAEVLKQVAQTRRIDSVQVAQYEAMGAAISDAIGAVRAYADGGPVGPTLHAFRNVLTAYEACVPKMKEHGSETMWEAGSLSGGDMTNQLLMEFSRFAAASLSPEDAGALLDELTGEQAKLSGDPAKLLMNGMRMSGQPTVSGAMPLILSMMVQAVAERSGQDPAAAMASADSLLSEDQPALSALPAGLVVEVLTSIPEDIGPNGVLARSPNGALVDKDFRSDSLKDKVGDIILRSLAELKVAEGDWVPRQTFVDLDRATYVVNGKSIEGATKEDRRDALASALATTTPEMARAIARCINQEALNTLVNTGNSTAFGEGRVMVARPGTNLTNEAIRQEDGSWLTRTTLVQTPAVIADPSGDMREIETDGVVLYSISFRITPGDMGGEPVTTIEDAGVIFAF